MRLIDADELLQEFDLETYIHNGGELWHWTGIKAMIENAPTVDAVEVVRCKDCKRWMRDVPICTDFVGRCGLANYMIGANGYCLYGERMNNGEKDLR